MTQSGIHERPSDPAATPPLATRQVMESVGDLLQHARKERGMSLDRVARSTRISLTQLESLEQGRFDELPGETYVRGFVRSYAKTVGVNGDDALVQYASERRAMGTTLRPAEHVVPKKRRPVGLLVVCSVFLLLLVVATLAVTRPRSKTGPGGWSQAEQSAGSRIV